MAKAKIKSKIETKCKYCNKVLLKADASIILELNANGVEKKIFLHSECVDEYKELMIYKKNEVTLFDEVYEYIKELLDYSSEQRLPNSLVTRLQDMRNGTINQRGVGRIVKSKEGYPYDVIYDTFLSNADAIRWAMSNKTFKTEGNKISYLMAIVDSHINDTYIRFKSKEDFNNVKKRDNIIEEEKEIKYISVPKINEIVKKNTGISKFLDEDEF